MSRSIVASCNDVAYVVHTRSARRGVGCRGLVDRIGVAASDENAGHPALDDVAGKLERTITERALTTAQGRSAFPPKAMTDFTVRAP